MSKKILFTLRPLNQTDIESIAHHANNRKIWEGVRDFFPFPYTEEDARSFVEYALSTEAEVIKAIAVKGNAVGVIGLHFKDDVMRFNCEIGYWIGVEFQGKGIVTQAIGQMVDIAFNHYNLLRIYAKVFSNNTSSCRVLEKNGFTLEASLKQSVVKDNKILDLLIFSRLNANYRRNNPT
jgi:RimJ/RimL family protein N-acetyltransferase